VCFLSDDARVFGFVRVATGDELSKRTKFVLITWIGAEVNALKRAKVSTDKTAVKSVVSVSPSISQDTDNASREISVIIRSNAAKKSEGELA
jgi:hypothetical protein